MSQVKPWSTRFRRALIYVMDIVACYLVPHMYATQRWKMQQLTICTIQILTGHKFPSVRPPWLRNPITGRNLELDGYSDTLRIGIEYNGIQHYKHTSVFHKDSEALGYQVYRDRLKMALCDEHGISLIVVPYTIPRDRLCSYILGKLRLVRDSRNSVPVV